MRDAARWLVAMALPVAILLGCRPTTTQPLGGGVTAGRVTAVAPVASGEPAAPSPGAATASPAVSPASIGSPGRSQATLQPRLAIAGASGALFTLARLPARGGLSAWEQESSCPSTRSRVDGPTC